jgi:hypothetical protein
VSHHDGPRPGDPRSSGPRPRPGGRDLAWASLALLVAVVTLVQFAALARALLRLPAAPTTGAVLAGFLVTVVWLLTVAWGALGAWRRSVWGCPFDHERTAAANHRCPRHHLVDPPGTG